MVKRNNMAVRDIQVNLQEAKATSTVLHNRFKKVDLDIAFIQQPYIY